MMKKNLKAFTLIELIIVMAIIGILMSALMNFYRPIRQTYVDSSMIENVRSSHDGILNYLGENVKFAENMCIYDKSSTYKFSYTDPGTGVLKNEKWVINTPQDAYRAFVHKYYAIDIKAYDDDGPTGPHGAKNLMTDSISTDKQGLDDPKILDQHVHIIVINRSTGYDVNGIVDMKDGFRGRLITNIVDPDEYGNTAARFTNPEGMRTQSADASGETYMALGGAYYGESDFGIYIDKSVWEGKTYNGSVKFAVQNSLTDESGVIKDGAEYGTVSSSKVSVQNGTVTVSSNETAKTMNIRATKGDVTYYLPNEKVLPDDYDDASAVPAGSISPTSDPHEFKLVNGNLDTFIVYTEPIENR